MNSEHSATVLIVNDDPDQRELMSVILSRSGFRIVVAEDGVEGYEVARAAHPALIISDVVMPRADGIELCRTLRSDPEFKATPIMLVSALRNDEANVIEGFRAGADEYIGAPYEPMRLVAQVSRLLERARAERALRESEERYRSLALAASQVVWTADAAGEVTADLPEWREITGQSADEVKGRGRLDALHPEDRGRVAEEWGRAVVTKSPYEVTFRVRARDGNYRYFSERAVPIQDERGEVREWVGASSDITERMEAEQALRRSEESLRQSQKMEAVGQLAGGVAHDFNNLLTAISGYADLSLFRLREADPISRNIKEIRNAAERASSLTRQLLAFSRQQVLQPKILDLNAVVSEMGKMMQRILGEHIQLTIRLGQPLGHVKADPGQIEQVLMNLLVNARDAMPRGGTITIDTQNYSIDTLYASQNVDVRPGHYVVLSVSDNGSGMTEEVRQRIFEPFFTTKEVGKGTGLGLSTVYGIVKQSGGFIWVYSELGKGTIFKIYLPQVDDLVSSEKKEAGIDDETLQGTETVLLVEDEPMVRALTRDILEMCGYHVLEAGDGGEAVSLCEGYEGEIELLLTDVVMPGMSGKELAKALTPLRPRMKVIYMSGYTDDAVSPHEVLDGGAAFLQKPFTPAALLRRLRETLDPKVASLHSAGTSNSVNESLPTTSKEQARSSTETKNARMEEQPVKGKEDTAGPGNILVVDQIRKPTRVLVIDDDVSLLQYLEKVLRDTGYIVSTAQSGHQGIMLAQDFFPDIILTDYSMPGMDGVQTIQSIRPITPDAVSILMTAYPDVGVITEALRQLVFDFLRKPFTADDLEQSLRRAIAFRESRERERRHKDFLSIISHELRAPLQAPLSYINNILAGRYGPLNAEQRERMRRAEQGINDEARLINNLLDLSYLESGQLRANLSRSSLRNVIQEVVNSFDVQANDAGVSVQWVVPKAEFLMDFDVMHFKQALSNLLDNAISHTPRGKSIKVKLRRRAAAVFCAVQDEGCGIRAIHLERIFDKSFKVHPRTSRKGLGMGLYIARQIIRAQGGDITVKSRLGAGSTFTIMLPA
jgi:PAS domain S-box-containing protein